jgi:DNA-binding transcriptional LysR family regulator
MPLELTLSQVECFVAALDAGSFTGAADLLDISQPAVAEQIQRLEATVGQSLFARQARGVRPTRVAQELEPHARQMLDAARSATAVVSEAGQLDGGLLSFGTFGSPEHYDMARLVRAFVRDHPRVRLRIMGLNSSSTANAVRDGTLDAAVVVLPIDDTGLEVRPLLNGEVTYVSTNAANTRRPVSIEALTTRPFILYEISVGVADPTRFQLAARAQAAGLRLEPRFEVESADLALELAVQGLGDTYAPWALRRKLDPRLHTAAFDPPLVDRIAIITRRGARLSRPVRAFIDRFADHLRSLDAAG